MPNKNKHQKQIKRSNRRCSVAECKTRLEHKRATHNWFCGTHADIFKHRGTPYAHTKKMPNKFIIKGDLTYIVMKDQKGKVLGLAKIDTDKIDLVKDLHWSDQNGYPRNPKTRTALHHLVYGKKVLLDHINRNPYDNRLSNLRVADKSTNAANMIRANQNTSGYKGVSWNKRNKNWVVNIKKNRKGYWCGAYKDIIEAAEAYNKRATELFGEFALLNEVKK